MDYAIYDVHSLQSAITLSKDSLVWIPCVNLLSGMQILFGYFENQENMVSVKLR